MRVRHPDQQFFRQLRRTIKSIRQLLLVAIFSAMSIGALIGMSFWVMPILTNRHASPSMPDWNDPETITTLIIAAVIVLLCGVVARTVFAHRGFLTTMVFIGLMACLFLSIDWSVGGLLTLVDFIAGGDARIDLPSTNNIIRRYLSMLGLLPIFALGMGVGVIVNISIIRSQHKRFVRLRRKLRKRQRRQD